MIESEFKGSTGAVAFGNPLCQRILPEIWKPPFCGRRNICSGCSRPEGYWVGELMVDSTLVSDTVAYHHWNGKVDREWQRKAVNHIFSMQLPDGGWNIYYGGPSEVNATIKAYLALKLAGVPVTDPRMLQGARSGAALRRRAAHEHVFQTVPRAARPVSRGNTSRRSPARCCCIGKWFHVNFWDMSNWSRGMLVPLAIINHFKPTRPVKVNLDELYPEGIHERDLALAPDPETISLRNFFLWLDRLHKLAEWFAEHDIHPFRKRALKNASNGCWNASKARTGWRRFSRRCSIRSSRSRRWAIPTTIRKSSAPRRN